MNERTPPEDASARPCEDCGDPPSPSRRRFLGRMSAALATAAGAAAAVPVVGVLVGPARPAEHRWRDVGAVDAFPPGDTVMVPYRDPEPLPWDGAAERTGAYVRREDDGTFVAFSIYCTHVGCPVTWTPGAQMFMCPCHGGTFHRDGSVAAGPPPRPLERFDVRVRDGRLELRTMGPPRTG
jgi:menaquinol-cytochrome c reductase iron-sulfur subunit